MGVSYSAPSLADLSPHTISHFLPDPLAPYDSTASSSRFNTNKWYACRLIGASVQLISFHQLKLHWHQGMCTLPNCSSSETFVSFTLLAMISHLIILYQFLLIHQPEVYTQIYIFNHHQYYSPAFIFGGIFPAPPTQMAVPVNVCVFLVCFELHCLSPFFFALVTNFVPFHWI